MDRFHNRSLDYFNLTDFSDIHFTISLHSWVMMSVALPLICLAIYGLSSIIKTDHIAPIYIINLLVSDIIQICIKPVAFMLSPGWIVTGVLYFVNSVGILASIFFMVCISGERYILIAHPLWYRFQKTIKKSLICSVMIWMAASFAVGGVFIVGATSNVPIEKMLIYSAVLCLLPYPFVLFFFIGTWRALSKSISLTGQEKRRIMGTLALVLFIYTVLFMPYIVMLLLMLTLPELIPDRTFQQIFTISTSLMSLNSLTDPILYVFARKKRLFILQCHFCTPTPQVENGQFMTQETDAIEEETFL